MTKASFLLKDVAYKKIKESILNERLLPGQFLSEKTLTDYLNMSKTPVKSALVILENEGFVTISSKQGIIINELSISKISDIYDLRTALETYVCSRLIDTITKEQIEKLQQNLYVTNEYVKKLDIENFAKLDHAFHLLLCEFINNKEIYRILWNYQDHLFRITIKHLRKSPNRMEIFIKEHKKIYEQLKNNDTQVINSIEKHLQNSKKTLLN